MKINGEKVLLKEETTILAFLERKELNKDRVVVEVNKIIIDKENFNYITLKEDDEVEIIAFVGGG